ncbi:hypothetical protein [Treponema sp. C6A8]|uniref:hypothetical protein n=1 Tax=Treponema sp. C6A8 TaxID=1410609 RepID=UPI0004863604|nr:hypothetical protein [Treponema sp. C6A8]
MEKIRNLHITLEKSDESGSEFPLKNRMQISYNGLNLFIDDQNPATISKSGTNQKIPVRLQTWEQDENSFTLHFTDDVNLTVGLNILDSDNESNEPLDSSLYAIADLPDNISALYLPFKLNSYMKIEGSEGSKTILSGKKKSWELYTPVTAEKLVGFTKSNSRLSYAIHNEVRKFNFESITDLAIADSALFYEVRNNIKTSLINAFKSNTLETNLNEQVAISYVAAQAESGNYTSAIEEVPASIKKSKTRTYLSTPYFNSLADMNKILETYIASTEMQIVKAATTNSLDLFTVRNIANFLCISENRAAVVQLLQNAANADISHTSLAQATGIIQTYIDLYTLMPEYAAVILPAVENCVARIGDACNYDGNTLTISENDTFVSVIQAAETGMALMRFGKIAENPVYEKSGYVIINSYLNGTNSFDLRTLSNLYPILFFDNSYYPHFEKIDVTDNHWTWAWTCAKDIRYKKDGDTSITLSIDFPTTYTHYLIIKGIPRFTSIYIYDISFRTDPRFENYNSSGYVYQADSKTLLLKSRHKQSTEDIRLDYSVRPVVVEPEPRPGVIDISPEAAKASTPEPENEEAEPSEEDSASNS